MLKCLVLTTHLFLPNLSDYPNLIPSPSSKNNTATKVLTSPSLYCNFFPGMSPFYSFFPPWSPLCPSLTLHIFFLPTYSLIMRIWYPILSSTALRSNQALAQSTDKQTLWLHTLVPFPFSWKIPSKGPFLPQNQEVICQHAMEDWADDI